MFHHGECPFSTSLHFMFHVLNSILTKNGSEDRLPSLHHQPGFRPCPPCLGRCWVVDHGFLAFFWDKQLQSCHCCISLGVRALDQGWSTGSLGFFGFLLQMAFWESLLIPRGEKNIRSVHCIVYSFQNYFQRLFCEFMNFDPPTFRCTNTYHATNAENCWNKLGWVPPWVLHIGSNHQLQSPRFSFQTGQLSGKVPWIQPFWKTVWANSVMSFQSCPIKMCWFFHLLSINLCQPSSSFSSACGARASQRSQEAGKDARFAMSRAGFLTVFSDRTCNSCNFMNHLPSFTCNLREFLVINIFKTSTRIFLVPSISGHLSMELQAVTYLPQCSLCDPLFFDIQVTFW